MDDNHHTNIITAKCIDIIEKNKKTIINNDKVVENNNITKNDKNIIEINDHSQYVKKMKNEETNSWIAKTRDEEIDDLEKNISNSVKSN